MSERPLTDEALASVAWKAWVEHYQETGEEVMSPPASYDEVDELTKLKHLRIGRAVAAAVRAARCSARAVLEAENARLKHDLDVMTKTYNISENRLVRLARVDRQVRALLESQPWLKLRIALDEQEPPIAEMAAAPPTGGA